MMFLRRLIAWADVLLTRWETRREKCTCAICCDQVEHTGKR